MGKGKEVAHVEIDKVPGDALRAIVSNDDATVVLEDGTVGTGDGVTKSDAIQDAARDAGAEADDDEDKD